MSLPLVAIVGRPNVGKSTLFNRLVGGRRAIAEKTPGVTRDRLYGKVTWLDSEFLVIDTGGIIVPEKEVENQVRKQALLAMQEASLILFVVDGRQGITPLDEEIAGILRRQEKPVILVVNKMEKEEHQVGEFYRFGLADPFPVSAAHGFNTGDLLDNIITFLPEPAPSVTEGEGPMRIAVAGRPNVGKSSLVNFLLGEERVIVSDEPGTTRDAVDTLLKRDGKDYILVDTAGIRKKSKVRENIEYYSVMRSLRAIENADIVLLLLDAGEGVIEQDQRIAGYVRDNGKALIILLHKWDRQKALRRQDGGKESSARVRELLKFVSYAPVLPTSIYEPWLLKRLFPLIEAVYEQYNRRITTPHLNRFLEDATAVNPLPTHRGKKGRIYYCTQPTAKPPTFVFFVNDSSLIHFSYMRYLENRLREAFALEHTPVKLMLKTRRRKGEG
ncbi:MAG: ribosome biogenesis GTPase Der [Bacillota bacterium]